MAAIYSKQATETLLELKRAAESLAPGLRIHKAHPIPGNIRPAAPNSGGRAGESAVSANSIPDLVDSGRAAILDLDLALLQELQPERASYKPVRRFPSSAFDLSVIAGARELAGNLELRIAEFAGDLAETVEYVREFQGAPLPEGRKSVTFRITAGSPDRTLSSAEITAIYDRIVAGLSGLGYEFRA